jgi:hypothetical protein
MSTQNESTTQETFQKKPIEELSEDEISKMSLKEKAAALGMEIVESLNSAGEREQARAALRKAREAAEPQQK